MLKTNKLIHICILVSLLLGLGLFFQNCAQPLDPGITDVNTENSETNPSTNESTALIFNATSEPLEQEEGQPIYISIEVTNQTGAESFEIFRNGSLISTRQFYEVRSVSRTDTFKVVVTKGSIVQEQDLFLVIKEASTTNPDPIDTTNPSGQVYLKNVDGTNSFTKYFLNVGATKDFAVEIDFSRTNTNYQNAALNWQVRTAGNEDWTYLTSDRDIRVSGEVQNFNKEYRVIAKHNGQIVGESDIIQIITQSYTSADASCSLPFVMAGLKVTKATSSSSTETASGSISSSSTTYSVSKAICKLPRDKEDPNNYLKYSRTTDHNLYKKDLGLCETQTRKTSLISSIDLSTLRSTNTKFSCGIIDLDSKDVFQTNPVSTIFDGDTVCPEYEYMVGLKRGNAYYAGHITHIVCAEIAD